MAIRDQASERRDLLMFSTEALTLITDPAHVLFDPSALEEVDQDLVANIMAAGVKKPIVIRTNGKDKKTGKDIVEIVDGRHRYKATVEANRRLKKNGEKHLILIPCVVEKGGDTDALSTMIITNEFNHKRSIIDRAKKAKRLQDRGIAEDEIAIHFGTHATTIGNWFKLLKCSQRVQDAVEQKVIPMTAALKWDGMDESAQDKALLEMVKSGATKGAAANDAAKNAKNGRPARPSNASTLRMRSRAFAEKLKDALRPAQNDEDDERFTVAEEVVAFMLGDNDAFKTFKEMKAIIKPLLEEKKTSTTRTKKVKPSSETIDL